MKVTGMLANKLFLAFAVTMCSTLATANCSDAEYKVFQEYDRFLDANPSISDDQLRSAFAKKKGMKPSALKDLYVRCLWRWQEGAKATQETTWEEADGGQGTAKRIAGNDSIGCKSKNYYSKLVEYAAVKDNEAFKKGLMTGMASGQCTSFKRGEPVFVTDTSIFSGLIQVRRKGGNVEYWTSLEWVK